MIAASPYTGLTPTEFICCMAIGGLGFIALIALVVSLCFASKRSDEEEARLLEECERDWQWPRAARVPPRFPHEARSHAVLVGDLRMPDRRVSR